MSWEDLLAAAAAQHGYFTTEQAAERGISRRALTWRAQKTALRSGLPMDSIGCRTGRSVLTTSCTPFRLSRRSGRSATTRR
jgi:hypothetical protein